MNIEESKLVGSVPMSEFIEALVEVLAKIDAAKKASGDPKLLELSVSQFTDLAVEHLKSRAMMSGAAEARISEQVLTDWQAIRPDIQAVTQPFRVKNVAEAHSLGDNLAKTFAPGFSGQLLVIVAVAHPDGSYGTL
jgi:hypothetical protein